VLDWLTGPNIILTLKVAVIAVTCLFVASLVALLRKNYRLHGRINTVFFVLTLTALLGLEVVARVLRPGVFEDYFNETGAWAALYVHLCFSLPAALVLFAMLYTGRAHFRNLHVGLGVLFAVLWVGTFITGVFFLPH
jgi:hypothetical protein